MDDTLSATLSGKDKVAAFLDFLIEIKHKILPTLGGSK
jgi:hypothetical protein